MILKMLKGKHPLYLIVIPVVAVLLWIKAFINPLPILSHNYNMPLYELLAGLCNGSQLALNVIAYLFMVVASYLLVRLNEEYIFIKQRTDLPAFIFILIACGTVVLKGMHPAMPAGLFLILALERTFGIYNGGSTISRSFDSGLLIGISSLFYLGAAPFLIWFWISLIILGYFRGREFMSGLVGFLSPLFFVFCWYFWNDQLPHLLRVVTVNTLQLGVDVVMPKLQLGYWGVLAFLVLLSVLFMFNSYEDKRTSSRKYFAIILWFLIFTILGYLFVPSLGIEQYLLASIPVTYLVSHYFVLQKHAWMGDVLFILLILASVGVHIFL